MAAGSNEIRVIAQAFTGPENVAAVRTALKNVVVPTRAEKGCIGYDLQRGARRSKSVLFFEIWESEVALEAHTRTVRFQELERAQPLMTQPIKITKFRKLA